MEKRWTIVQKDQFLNDKTAQNIIDKVGIDFTKHKRGIGEKIFAVRAKQYDKWVNDLAKVSTYFGTESSTSFACSLY